jgi:signal transduction histidine kinase
VALASHELRTPVAAIYGAVRTLDAREKELPPAQRAELRRMLSRQAEKLNELVQNLLDLSRLEADAIRLEPTELDLRAKVEEISKSVLGVEQTVEIDVADGLRAVVDVQAFERIVGNLLVNAARHGAPPIRVAAARTHRELSLVIEDHGPGVPPGLLASIFERFTRGATASTAGAGLGLAIAQSYARAHGGTITHEPALPHGARFRVTLPAS